MQQKKKKKRKNHPLSSRFDLHFVPSNLTVEMKAQ